MKRNKIVKLALTGVAVALSMSSCGIFRKGCKCPPVHRHTVGQIYQDVPLSEGLGNGNRAQAGGPVFQ